MLFVYGLYFFHTEGLFTHEKLKEATALYIKAGFKEIEAHPGLYDPTGRCSVLMKYSLLSKGKPPQDENDPNE